MSRPGARPESLFLVGTCHRDPRGRRRCRILLDHLDPDVVLVEVSPYGVWIRREHRRFFLRLLRRNLAAAAAACGMSFSAALRTPSVRHILLQCALPFELRAAQHRYVSSGTPYFCVDRSDASRLFLSDWPHLLSSRNLYGLLGSDGPATPSVADEYGRARAAFNGAGPQAYPFSSTGVSVWEQRERWLEKSVRTTLRVLQPPRLVYLGGWTHVVPNRGRSLSDRLRDLAPVSLLLDEADRFEAVRNPPPQPSKRPARPTS